MKPTQQIARRAVSKKSKKTAAAVKPVGRFAAIASRGHELGLFKDKKVQIGGRVNEHLLEEAKRQSGVESDSELLDLALASLAINDGFAELVDDVWGSVDPDLELEFLDD